jgi:hypothetical protein
MPPSPVSPSPPGGLAAELACVHRLARRASKRSGAAVRLLRKLLRITKNKKPASERLTIHLRLLYDVGDEWVAGLMTDFQEEGKAWEPVASKVAVPSLRICKTPALEKLVEEEALGAFDVLRAEVCLDAHRARKSHRSVLGLFTTRQQGSRMTRTPKPARLPGTTSALLYAVKPAFVTLRGVVRVLPAASDAAHVYLQALEIFPPPPGTSVADPAAHARSCGLMQPPDVLTVAASLARLGVQDLVFGAAACELGNDGAARFAADPRFREALGKPRSACANAAVRALMDGARAWRPDAVVLAPRRKLARGEAYADLTLPVVFRPDPPHAGAPANPVPVRLDNAATGAYISVAHGAASTKPRTFVLNEAAGSKVVAYAMNGHLNMGSSQMPPGERYQRHTWVPPTLSLCDVFANRLETAAFDGDAAWSDAELRSALGLAKRVVFLFRELGTETQREMQRRASAMVGVQV